MCVQSCMGLLPPSRRGVFNLEEPATKQDIKKRDPLSPSPRFWAYKHTCPCEDVFALLRAQTQSLRIVITMIISGEEKNIFILATYFMCMAVLSVLLCAWPGAHGDLEKTLAPVELELEMVAVSVLGIKSWPL